MAALEGSLARMLQDFQKDRKALTAAFAAERSEAQGDIRALRQLAKARGRALHKVPAPPATPLRPHSLYKAALQAPVHLMQHGADGMHSVVRQEPGVLRP